MNLDILWRSRGGCESLCNYVHNSFTKRKKPLSKKLAKWLFLLVNEAGFEPATFGFGGLEATFPYNVLFYLTAYNYLDILIPTVYYLACITYVICSFLISMVAIG